MPTLFKNGVISKNGVNQGIEVPDADTDATGTVVKGTGKFEPPQFVQDFIDSTGFGKHLRSKNIPKNGEAMPGEIDVNKHATFKKTVEQDWRVKLSVPNIEPFTSSPMLKELKTTGGLVFPYTPTIIVAHSANYNTIAPTHTNYPYFAYQNSQVDQLVITGDFFVQNGAEARYWVNALHYLRSMTKMFFGGEAETIGAPPPIVKLSGYGDYIFNNVPVIITQFTVDLPQDVDYIATGIKTGNQTTTTNVNNSEGEAMNDTAKTRGIGWAPAQSLITVTVQPVYSRREIEKFSLQNYVNGNYIRDGGFI
tara:strand:- start:2220 stop:3143 length:924 start_codon:yes stop_codon:yes gene_type:complete